MDSTSIFIFSGHTFDLHQGKATFFYQLKTATKTYDFTEELLFPTTGIKQTSATTQVQTAVLDMLLLMCGISYYKLLCPKIIQTPTIQLSEQQAAFWQNIYTKGLGEFFYKNAIDYRNLIQFPIGTSNAIQPVSFPTTDRSLLLFGGGKDSIVSAETLKSAKKLFSLFMVNESIIQKESAALVMESTITLTRKIDPLLLSLNNEREFYNGHVPTSAIWACIGLLTAVLYDYRFVIASNEHSANYGNVEYLGEEINHQWSKSLVFEKLFQSYVTTYITPDITYFSLLRPYHEIKIVQDFAQHKKYFPVFSSCNRNFTIHNKLTGTRWCGVCPKCLFVFTLLAAFLPKKIVIDIFGRNLFADKTLLPLLQELLGLTKTKPFECVGTPAEIKLALIKAFERKEYATDPLMQYFTMDILPSITSIQELENDLLTTQVTDTIPKQFIDIL